MRQERQFRLSMQDCKQYDKNAGKILESKSTPPSQEIETESLQQTNPLKQSSLPNLYNLEKRDL